MRPTSPGLLISCDDRDAASDVATEDVDCFSAISGACTYTASGLGNTVSMYSGALVWLAQEFPPQPRGKMILLVDR